ncbi:DNA translocase FtsK [Aneurinibacillus sp. Ricciae_BoGa-3]|uniref:DNA translocase FtsK n=1 Tax=Aneurinibacillus sp. Ricciae_BoGa-3 TaxID=3022697 RepID=UPI0023409CA0|nr:DNA translocase FtsK [Aneurinibacillus sp. Ricciae_BoGa-3]WCK55729.1 DNA translocase FtsK [Aneurinibacillus sp. Ricciae_BoGa-3]
MNELFRRLKVWLQTFYNQEYEEIGEAEAKQERRDVYSSAGNKNLSIRTARIYPKGDVVERDVSSVPLASPAPRTVAGRNQQKNSFRFPLIPDNQADKPSFPRTAGDHSPQKRIQQKPASPVTRHVDAGRIPDATEGAAPVNRPRSEEKKPFRPTEVISPVYGYKRPEPKEEMKRENTGKPNHSEQPVHSKQPVHSEETGQSAGPGDLSEKLMGQHCQTETERQLEWEEEKPDWFLSGLQTSADNSTTEQDTVLQAEPIILKREYSRELEPETHSNSPFIEVVQQREQQRPLEKTCLPAAHAPEPSGLEDKQSVQADQPDSEEGLLAVEPVQSFNQTQSAPSHPAERSKQFESSLRAESSIGAGRIVSFAAQGQVHKQGSGSFSQEGSYSRPATSLLHPALAVNKENTNFVHSQQELLAVTLQNFNVHAEVIGTVQGPTVTRYEVQPAPGVKVNKITNLVDDIKLSLAARDIRIEAPIPGRSAVGIEVPNEESVPVYLRGIFESEAFQSNPSPLAVALGLDIGGEPVIADLSKMPHGLIAGATGSGKSVCINSIIVSLLYKASPDEVRLLLIDPKMVELAPYNRLPHLVAPVVTDPKQATAALKWAVGEMDRRYEKFAEAGARDISRYNELMRRSYPDIKEYILPTIVIIIDELADLMMVAPGDVEECICRIAQKARACGIHLLVATQRPSVDVITGLIKANIPTRIAFSVSSQTDSRTILDMNGAERLLGRGDMLYLSSGSSKPVRLQGPYVSDDEIEAVTDFVKSQAETNYLFEKEDLSQIVAADQSDELFAEAVLFCIENGQASASSLQRNFHIGYNRAARLIDMMTDRGFISGQSGSKARDVFLTQSEYEELFLNDSRI